jgi:HSF-type DNA-binding
LTPRFRFPNDYFDFADKDNEWIQQQVRNNELQSRKLRGTDNLFPATLHNLLETTTSSKLSSVIRWLAHGRAFKVYDRQGLVEKVLPEFFRGQKQFGSFQRQLNIYGFYQLTGDHDDKGAYYHPFLLRFRPALTKLILPLTQSRGKRRRTFDASTEPDFDEFPRLAPALSSTDYEFREATRAATGDSIAAPTRQHHCNSNSNPGHTRLLPNLISRRFLWTLVRYFHILIREPRRKRQEPTRHIVGHFTESNRYPHSFYIVSTIRRES